MTDSHDQKDVLPLQNVFWIMMAVDGARAHPYMIRFQELGAVDSMRLRAGNRNSGLYHFIPFTALEPDLILHDLICRRSMVALFITNSSKEKLNSLWLFSA